jgi:hypothetical protein
MAHRRTCSFALLSTILLTSCAGPAGMAYSVASGTSLVATGKSIPEHAMSELTGADCSVVSSLMSDRYVCEQQGDAGTRYNRNAF